MADEKAITELQKEIDKIDFTGGLALVGAPSSTPEGPDVKPAEEKPATPVQTEEAPKLEKGTPVEGETPVEKPAAEVSESTPAKSDESPADDRPAIPDSHYRAAIHMGYKPEQIASLYDANPELALQTVAKAYEMVNASSKQLGELGQKARQMQDVPPQSPPTKSRKAAVLEKLKEKYEDDPILDVLGELIPDEPQRTQSVQQTQPVQQVNTETESAIRQQINNFFSADEMAAFADTYGNSGDWNQLLPGHQANRREVCNRAQMILDGAALAGMQMTVPEALERAHLEVVAPIAEQIVRERIAKSVQKRAAGVTLKPSGSKTPLPPAGAYNKEQAVTEMKAELHKVFGT